FEDVLVFISLPSHSIPERCLEFVKNYVTGDQCVSDSGLVADDSLEFAKTVEIRGDGKDVWIFYIEKTLLSNLPYYAEHGFETEIFNDIAFNQWPDSAACLCNSSKSKVVQ
ncbi:hypothetical protein IFM89_025045, partial [Coptis chinensis]